MCGRYSQSKPPSEIASRFGTRPIATNLQPRYNIAPTQSAPIVRAGGDGRTLSLVRWGLVPHWAKDLSIGAKMINARSETVAEKPAFRNALKSRRCLVIADGFYEWEKVGAKKQPWRFVRHDDGLFAMAGLWETWGSEKLETFTILTTGANVVTGRIHDRMPVILPDAEAEAAWLDAPDPTLLRPAPDDLLRAYRVSDRVNSPRNDEAGLIGESTPNSL